MQNVSSSNSEKALVPKLRFPEFTDVWEENRIGNLVDFIKGAPLSKNDISISGNPLILYGELYTTYKEITHNVFRKTTIEVDKKHLSQSGDVLIPTSGETPEEIATATCVMMDNVVLAGDLIILRDSSLDGQILSYIINHKVNRKISRIAQGKSVVHVQPKEIAKINICYPNRKEQNKLASFLELINKKIQLQQQLIENLKLYKRGVLSLLFNRNGNWKKVKISDCLMYEQPQKYIVKSEHYNDTFEIPVLTANKAFILGYTNEKQGVYNKGNVIIYDDFTMELKFVNFPFKIKSSTIKLLTTKGENDLYFMFCLLKNMNLKPESHQRTYISRVEKAEIFIPDLKVQTEISLILSKLDRRLSIYENLQRKNINTKSALLQQLFI